MDKPTNCSPITDTDTSCLDHMLHNLSKPTKSFVITPNISDHYAVCFVSEENTKTDPIRIKIRDYSARNQANFQRNATTEYQKFSPPESAQMYARYLILFLFTLMNKYFPKKTKTVSSKVLKSPWVTQSILRCIRKKHRWYGLMKQGIITNNSYKAYTSRLRALIRTAEQEYHENRFNSLGKDCKRNWKILNKLLGRAKKSLPKAFRINNGTTSDPNDISNMFCEYFVNHPKNIHSSIPDCNIDFSNLIRRNESTLYLYPVTENEIRNIINNLKNEGHISDISRKFLKLSSEFVVSKLKDLFNLCISQGVFPDVLKIAKVTPVHKKGPPDLIANYRPISVLCNMAKIFECLLYKRLQSFFTEQRLLSEKQYGFRKGKKH